MDASRQTRADEPQTESAAELHEQIGYVRCELDAAQERLAALRRDKADLEHQCEAAQREVAQLRHDLEQHLSAWCELDDLDQHRDKLGTALARLERIRGSLTYRAAALLLRGIHRVRAFVTFEWLRRRPPT